MDLIEKDYILGWIMLAIAHSSASKYISFKGGTAISKVYFPQNWRISEDLDFTRIGSGDFKEIGTILISELIEILARENDILARANGNLYTNDNYLQLRIQYDGPISRNTVKIEVTTEEYIGPFLKKDIPQVYDYPEFSLNTYSLENILSEKIRAILQRGKIRDYYDVWRLLRDVSFDPRDIKEMFLKKCDSKDVIYEDMDQFFPENLAPTLEKYKESGLTRLTSESLPSIEKMLQELRVNLSKILLLP